MQKNPVVFFEIAVTDMGRAITFYETVFKTTLTIMDMGGDEMAMFPWADSGINASGALVKGENYHPSASGTKVYFECQDVNDELALALSNGGELIMPKMNINEHGNIAMVKDTEGNIIGLHSTK